MMGRQLAIISLLLHLPLLAVVLASAEVPPSPQNDDNVKPGCQFACGDVSIPYPFGIGAACFLNESFNITCNNSIPLLGDGNIDIVKINLADGLMVVNNYIAHDCYNQDRSSSYHNEPSINIRGLPNYKFSNTRNKFIAVGCDTIGYISQVEEDGSNIWTGCSLFCNTSSHVPDDGSCSGIGCCSVPIPKDLQAFNISVYSFDNHTESWDFNPCGFAFVTDDYEGHFKFNRSSLTELGNVSKVPVTLDWAIMGENCEQAQQGNKSNACVSSNSNCSDSPNGPGYLCKCSNGFQGNPYLPNGCKDIDECAAPESPCSHKCKNLLGNHSCSCPWHMYGDGTTNGSGCKSIFKIIYAVLGAGFGLLVAISIISWVYYAFKKKRMMELKEKFFQQNGGLLLRQQHNSMESGRPSATKLFSLEEILAATDNYKPSRILGEGGAGTVYRGVLPDQAVVAIKKAKVPNEIEVEQFINEVNILSHINHRNVVRLLGCCLEEQVPLLVYEFVPNGTLSHHIHGEDRRGSLSLHHRLRIATEVADALFYLHSAASVPVIHRDVKSTNILLDDNLTAKVSDFGASRLVPLDQNGLMSLVRGTFGYLDPEYLLSGQFTDKSDVYSFGVVLVELLTGENPIDKSRPVEHRYLAAHFTTSVDGGRLFEVLEDRVRDEGTRALLVAAAELAKSCLSVKGENRPSMREVAIELEGLRKLAGAHPWVEEVSPEEAEFLLEDGNRSSAIGPDFEDQYGSSLYGMVPFDIMR